MVIYNFESVFSIERRLHKIDASRGGDQGLNQVIPLGGIPIRGIAYTAAVCLLTVVMWRLPLVGALVGPWWFQLLLAIVIARLMLRYEPDGRGAHLFLLAAVGHAYRRVRELERAPNLGGKYRVGWDASDAALHRAKIQGPATVEFHAPVEDNDRWNGWFAEGGAGRPCSIEVRDGQTLRVRP